ncbi:MAG: type II secretion system F family protein [Actinomycetota bacterium]
MSTAARLVLGVVTGSGLLVIMAGIRGVDLLGRASGRIRARHSRRDETLLVEALAVWTEQLRDTMAGASGLEQALSVTSTTAPDVLRPAVQKMSARLGFTSLAESARSFAEDVDHALADFVAAALITAAENQVRDMGSLLGHLADCCRADVQMRTRIWVARARLRSAVRIITIVVISFVLGLCLLNPSYLKPYGTSIGALVLTVIVAVFGGALYLMQRLGRVDNPDRFVARRTVVRGS